MLYQISIHSAIRETQQSFRKILVLCVFSVPLVLSKYFSNSAFQLLPRVLYKVISTLHSQLYYMLFYTHFRHGYTDVKEIMNSAQGHGACHYFQHVEIQICLSAQVNSFSSLCVQTYFLCLISPFSVPVMFGLPARKYF